MTQMAYNINDFDSIGRAIRSRNNQKSKYLLSEMPDKIRALIWRGTQAEYDQLETKDPTVLYIIGEED